MFDFGTMGPALNDQGIGALDPRMIGLLSAAGAMGQASGPSPMPMSLGQIMGAGLQAGIGAYGNTMEANRKYQQTRALIELEKQKAALAGRQAEKMKQDMDFQNSLMQQFGSGGALNINTMTPEALDRLAALHFARGDHVNAAAVMNTADKRRALAMETGALTSMQSSPGMPEQPAIPAPPEELGGGPARPSLPPTPGRPGLMGPLMQSPYVGPSAQQLQGAINARAITSPDALKRFEQLTQLHTMQSGLDARQQENFQMRREMQDAIMANKPAPAVTPVTIEDPQNPGKSIIVDARTRQVIGTAPANKTRNPMAEQLYKDYANHPQVKQAQDLETKMTPIAQYMVNFARTGKSVNANDAALAKMYLAETSSLGNRAYVMDKKELGSLPNLGDRLGNMASAFFSGKDLTDTTRREMWDYIMAKYRSADAMRQAQRQATENRARANMVPIDQVFGAAQ